MHVCGSPAEQNIGDCHDVLLFCYGNAWLLNQLNVPMRCSLICWSCMCAFEGMQQGEGGLGIGLPGGIGVVAAASIGALLGLAVNGRMSHKDICSVRYGP